MMTRKKTANGLRVALVAMGIVGSTVGLANAGTITAVPLPNDETAIVNTGEALISACDFGDNATSPDINGIVHTSGSWNVSGLTFNATFQGDYRGGEASAAGYTGDMLELMEGIGGKPAPGPISLEISGLTVGKQYLFQGYWEANNYGQTVSVTFEGTDTQGGITGTGVGVLISYTFTAGDTSLDADLTKTGGTENPWWQGYCLQEIPGPAATPGTLIYGK